MDQTSNRCGAKDVDELVLSSLTMRDLLLIVLVSICSMVCLILIADRIDFHPDEAIYLSRVPVNLENDSGLFYSAWYWLSTLGSPTPLSARWATAALSAGGLGCLLVWFSIQFPAQRRMLLVVIPAVLLVSYQGVFLSLRVRPELSWMCVAAASIAALSAAAASDRQRYRLMAIVLLTLLPMNHRFCWLACALIGGYLVVFGWTTYGSRFTCLGLAAMLFGAVLNVLLRPVLIGESLAVAYQAFVSAPDFAPPRFTFPKFIVNVFWDCSLAHRDFAANGSWWDKLMPASVDAIISHHFFANLIFAAGCFLPFFGRTWRQGYMLSVPLAMLLLLFIAGYFNPTYFAVFAVYVVCCFAFVAFQREQAPALRILAAMWILLSVFNGASFLSTRVLNHGRASMFDVEPQLRAFVQSLPENASVAVPERFQSIVAGHPGPSFVLYKDVLPEDIEVVVVDDYDFEMYCRFIPDHKEKQAQIDFARNEFELVRSRTLPIYRNDKMHPSLKSGELASMQGSWFFRNSTQYNVSVLRNSRPVVMIAAEQPGDSLR